jgi:surfactin synthase thioesterase subunit
MELHRRLEMMPLFIEATLMALFGFSAGVLVAYFIALRRHWIA